MVIKRTLLLISAMFCAFLVTGCGAKDSVSITNVRVFDGEKLSGLKSVMIKNGRIVDSEKKGKTVIDANGGTLLPGFIDSHLHAGNKANMEKCAEWGITTVFDMGSRIDLIRQLREEKNLPDILASGIAAAPEKGIHAKIGCVPLLSTQDAKAFVKKRADEKVDYIKVIVDSPDGGAMAVLDHYILETLVQSAHERGLKVVAHVTLGISIELCIGAGVDVITHLPLVHAVDEGLALMVSESGIVSIPTLIMMKCFAENASVSGPRMDYRNAQRSFAVLEKTAVNILGGTDANSNVCAVEHGKGLHKELKLMVDAGMTNAKALQSVTSLPAKYFGLKDRGVIASGMRADLLLVDGNPLEDISATEKIHAVWLNGKRIR